MRITRPLTAARKPQKKTTYTQDSARRPSSALTSMKKIIQTISSTLNIDCSGTTKAKTIDKKVTHRQIYRHLEAARQKYRLEDTYQSLPDTKKYSFIEILPASKKMIHRGMPVCPREPSPKKYCEGNKTLEQFEKYPREERQRLQIERRPKIARKAMNKLRKQIAPQNGLFEGEIKEWEKETETQNISQLLDHKFY